MEKAIEIATTIGNEEFKASNGWLTQSRGISGGESGDANLQTVESWMEHLPSIVAGFTPKDIWNCDETGLFWKALPEAEKKKACKGG